MKFKLLRKSIKLAVLLLGILLHPSFIEGQEKPKEVAKEISKSTSIVEPSNIPIPQDFAAILKSTDLELENAKLKAQNLDLQLRLFLKIPNDFIRVGDHYEKPKPTEAPP